MSGICGWDEKTMKTIKAWFESAEEPLRSKLLKNMDPVKGNMEASSFSTAIVCGFIWSQTPVDEGHDHWLRIFNEYAGRVRDNKKSDSEEPVEDGDGCPDVPDVTVEDSHWKVGDGMSKKDGTPDYIIGQIALVGKPPDSSGNRRFDFVIFDTKGIERCRRSVTQD